MTLKNAKRLHAHFLKIGNTKQAKILEDKHEELRTKKKEPVEEKEKSKKSK